jgi:hypothetical protein
MPFPYTVYGMMVISVPYKIMTSYKVGESILHLVMCPSSLSSNPAEVLPKVAYDMGVSALNLVQVFVFKRCILNSNTLFRP